MTMKFLFVAPRYHTNQAHIIETLKDNGHEVFFLASRIGRIENHSLLIPKVLKINLISKMIIKIFGPGPNFKNYFPNFLILWKEIMKIKPNIIIIRPHGKIFSYLSVIYGIMLGSKIIFYEQVNSKYLNFNMSNNFLYNFIRKSKFYLPLFIFNAAWMTPLLDKNDNFMPNKCYYIPFAVPIFKKKEKVNSPVHFVMVAKYQILKRHSLLIKAFHELKESYKFKATFIGELSNDAYPNLNEHIQTRKIIEEEINEFNLNKQINFIDNLSHLNLMENYKNFDVFILPTSNDNAAISLLEANGQGLPVICSDMSGTDTYIENNYNGFVFKSDDITSLKEKIEFFLKNPLSIYKMSNNSINHAKLNFSNKSYYSSLGKLLSDHFDIKL